ALCAIHGQVRPWNKRWRGSAAGGLEGGTQSARVCGLGRLGAVRNVLGTGGREARAGRGRRRDGGFVVRARRILVAVRIGSVGRARDSPGPQRSIGGDCGLGERGGGSRRESAADSGRRGGGARDCLGGSRADQEDQAEREGQDEAPHALIQTRRRRAGNPEVPSPALFRWRLTPSRWSETSAARHDRRAARRVAL